MDLPWRRSHAEHGGDEKDYPDVEVVNMLVDAAATALCLQPTHFDVMVMENMFGDILSDQGRKAKCPLVIAPYGLGKDCNSADTLHNPWLHNGFRCHRHLTM